VPGTQTGYSNANELSTAYGYTQGGIAIASPTSTEVEAASLTAWTTGTAYNIGDTVNGASSGAGHVYRCLVGGTSGSSVTFAGAIGEKVSDGTCSWGECGLGVVKIGCANLVITVTGVVGPFQYAAFYDSVATQPVSNPYVCYVNFGSTQQSGSSGTLTLSLDALGQILWPIY
jgi:hypothetical protein